MDIANAVLALLEESGAPLSGEGLAARLGVSRNAVWKAVGKLRAAGYEIEAATNRGYLLRSDSNVLAPANIRRYLVGSARQAALDVRPKVGSTNAVVKELAERGGCQGMVVIAEEQTAGRGRLGRSFLSPKGDGLYMSVLLRPRFPAGESLSITTAAAAAVAQAIEDVTGRAAGIKWVNDIYLDGYKVCGILTEASVDFETQGLRYAVLGIGINVREPAGGFPQEIAEIAGALYRGEPPLGLRNRLAAQVLNHFFAYYDELPQRTYLPEYRRRSLLTGMEIAFSEGGRRRTGVVLGVDEEARLLARLPDGSTAAFSAGEVDIQKDFLAKLRAGKENGYGG